MGHVGLAGASGVRLSARCRGGDWAGGLVVVISVVLGGALFVQVRHNRSMRAKLESIQLQLEGFSGEVRQAHGETDQLRKERTELQKELTWGIQQVTSGNVQTIVEMAVGLIEEREYRKEANDAIAKEGAAVIDEQVAGDEAGSDEVKFSVAMWEGDYNFAFETARSIAEHATSPAMAGYRGWWWYLASVAARLAGK